MEKRRKVLCLSSCEVTGQVREQRSFIDQLVTLGERERGNREELSNRSRSRERVD